MKPFGLVESTPDFKKHPLIHLLGLVHLALISIWKAQAMGKNHEIQNIQFHPESLLSGDIVYIDLHGELVVAV